MYLFLIGQQITASFLDSKYGSQTRILLVIFDGQLMILYILIESSLLIGFIHALMYWNIEKVKSTRLQLRICYNIT
jgi:hypothetical protein